MRNLLVLLFVAIAGCDGGSSPREGDAVPKPEGSQTQINQSPTEKNKPDIEQRASGDAATVLSLADALRDKRVVLSMRGRESWMEFHADGTTLDQKGVAGRFTIEGSVLTIRDDAISTVEFNSPNPGPGDPVKLSMRRQADAPLLGPFQANIVKITTATGLVSRKQAVKTGNVSNSTEAFLTVHPHPGKIVSIAWNPDGTRIASAGSPSFDLQSGKLLPSEVKIWDAISGKAIESFPGGQSELPELAWRPDGKQLAVSFAGTYGANLDVTGTRVAIWEIPGGQEICSIQVDETLVITSLDWSPDGKRLAGIAQETALIWTASTGKLHAEMKAADIGESSLTCLDWNPIDNRIAIGTDESTVKIWDPTGKQPVRTLQLRLKRFEALISTQKIVQSVAWSPNGKRLVAGNVKSVVWDAETGKELLSLAEQEMAHSHPQALTWSPDGTKIAGQTGSSTRHDSISVWDASTGREVLTVKGHSLGISDLTWGPDGKAFAASGKQSSRVLSGKKRRDHSVKIWKLPNDSLITIQDVKTGDVATLTRKIQDGANINQLVGSSATPLHHAIAAGRKPIFLLLLKHGAKVTRPANVKLPVTEALATTGSGTTPLHLACMKGQQDFIAPLLAKGADVNAKNRFGQTALDLTSKPEITKLLRDHGGKWGTLRGAVRGGDLATVKKLLAEGANPNRWRSSGFPGDSALHIAVEHGNLELARLLIQHGAKVDRSSTMGAPLHRAVSDGHLGLVKLLIDNKANVNSTAGFLSKPPLHYIAGDIDVIVRRRETTGSNKIMGSELQKRKAIAELLIEHGARINARTDSDSGGRTVLDEVKNHKELADLLRKHSAKSSGSAPGPNQKSLKGAADQDKSKPKGAR